MHDFWHALPLSGEHFRLALFALVGISFIAFWRTANKRPLRLPPSTGPPPDRTRAHLHWEKMAAQPGHEHLSSFVVGKKVTIILNSAEACQDLLEGRSSVYSSRPPSVLTDIARRGMTGQPLSHRHKNFRPWRKFIGTTLGRAERFRELQLLESLDMLRRFIERPEDWRAHVVSYTSNIAITVSYGRRSQKADEDPAIVFHRETQRKALQRVMAGSLVEAIPLLRFTPNVVAKHYLPELVAARAVYNEETPILRQHMEESKRRTEAGASAWSMTRAAHEQGLHETGLPYDAVAYAVAQGFTAGIDTTTTYTTIFLHAALLQGHTFLAKAKQELDEVVGPDRLPNADDDLPFIGAVVKEAARYYRPGPIALPHAAADADSYMGFDIPKNATILPNIWAIARDERTYADAMTFRPERWLDGSTSYQYPIGMYGHGRRFCPGAAIGFTSLVLAASRLLWAFEISATGPVPDDPSQWISMGVLTWPADLPIAFKPRSQRHEAIVREEYEAAKPDIDAMTRDY